MHHIERVTRLDSFLNSFDGFPKVRQSEAAVNMMFVLAFVRGYSARRVSICFCRPSILFIMNHLRNKQPALSFRLCSPHLRHAGMTHRSRIDVIQWASLPRVCCISNGVKPCNLNCVKPFEMEKIKP